MKHSDPVKRNKTRSAASARAWESRKRMKEAREIREKARLIEPSGLHAVKAEYRDKVILNVRKEFQLSMKLKD